MADVSPFLSTPGQWVEKLARLRADRQKIEEAEDRLREKLREHMEKKSLAVFSADTHEARIERLEVIDFSQKSLSAAFGEKWLEQARKKLPVKVSESLVIREIKAETQELGNKFIKHFGGRK